MSEFSLSMLSYSRLRGVDRKLIALVELAIQRTPIDFGIAYMGGRRTDEQQNMLYREERSQKDGYNTVSKHQLGEAVDFLPYINGKPDMGKENHLIIIGVFFACANEMGITIRSGANWDRDQEFLTDQNFDDLPHIELVT